jgi:signal peptide peptidase-like protein 2B
MVCANNGTFKDITIPSVMLPRAAGSSLEGALALDEEGTLLV